MNCKVTDLRNKDVINCRDGSRLGYVNDVEVDTCSARLVSIIIYGRLKFFGLLGREDDIVINWCDIEVIGEDTILVSCDPSRCYKKCDSRMLDGILKNCKLFS